MPYQRCPSPPMTPALYEQSRRAVQVITSDGRQLSAGRAALFILQQIDYLAPLTRLGSHRPLIWAVELAYRLVASNRPLFARILFRHIVPTPAELAAIGAT